MDTTRSRGLQSPRPCGACSPGTLPGSPSPLSVGGGGARYNGTITYRRLSGGYTLSESAQSLNLSLTMRGADQILGRYEVGGSTGTLQGVLSGNLASGTFQATTLVVTAASMGGTTTSCEGRGQVTGSLSGRQPHLDRGVDYLRQLSGPFDHLPGAGGRRQSYSGKLRQQREVSRSRSSAAQPWSAARAADCRVTRSPSRLLKPPASTSPSIRRSSSRSGGTSGRCRPTRSTCRSPM